MIGHVEILIEVKLYLYLISLDHYILIQSIKIVYFKKDRKINYLLEKRNALISAK